jgi:biotin carboxyl carrier protein
VAERTVLVRHGDREYPVTIDERDDGTRARVGDRTLLLRREAHGIVRVAASSSGEPAGTVATAWIATAGESRWVFCDGRVFELEVAGSSRGPARPRGRARSGSGAPATAPMPATVRRIDVSPGQAVRKGDTLIILEAMKMELPVKAGADGTVTAINCREGELVQPGVPLLDLAEA